ncbi:unnamed protein product [Lampetra fluviatilis]
MEPPLLKRLARWLLVVPRFLASALALCLLDLPCVRRRAMRSLAEEARRSGTADTDPPWRISDSERTFTRASLAAVWRGHVLDAFKEARAGGLAPNTPVERLDGGGGPSDGASGGDGGGTSARVLDFAHGSRPLVLSFGSGS